MPSRLQGRHNRVIVPDEYNEHVTTTSWIFTREQAAVPYETATIRSAEGNTAKGIGHYARCHTRNDVGRPKYCYHLDVADSPPTRGLVAEYHPLSAKTLRRKPLPRAEQSHMSCCLWSHVNSAFTLMSVDRSRQTEHSCTMTWFPKFSYPYIARSKGPRLCPELSMIQFNPVCLVHEV